MCSISSSSIASWYRIIDFFVAGLLCFGVVKFVSGGVAKNFGNFICSSIFSCYGLVFTCVEHKVLLLLLAAVLFWVKSFFF